MFKKLILLLVTFCYLLSVTGTTIDKFYCCGKLKKTSIFFKLQQSKPCSKKKAMKGCCQYYESFYKVKDTHQSGLYTTAPAPYFIEANYSYSEVNYNISQYLPISKTNYANGPPPLLSQPSIYIRNCNFRR